MIPFEAVTQIGSNEANPQYTLVDIYFDQSWNLFISGNLVIWAMLGGLVVIAVILWRWLIKQSTFHEAYEIDRVSIGLGNQNVNIKPNYQDRQIAYKLWVELYTRKIGLTIDLDHDVVYEVYDSWYSFFKITRELIKEIPASKIRKAESTQKIVDLCIDVLNMGLRPHLTKWQARYRQWYEKELEKESAQEAALIEPQELQRQFPKYDELEKDLLSVNEKLVWYRKNLEQLWKA